MGRARFNEREVVHAATQLFWQYGYQSVSMQDLVKGTGLNPGSLYHAFDNKEGLYTAALATYVNESCQRIETRLESAESVGNAICQMLVEMVADATAKEFCSCFLVRSQLELAKDGETHADLLQLIDSSFARVQSIYEQAIAKEYGEDNAVVFAASLMMHIFGLRVYGNQNRSEAEILTALQSGLPWLPWEAIQKKQ